MVKCSPQFKIVIFSNYGATKVSKDCSRVTQAGFNVLALGASRITMGSRSNNLGQLAQQFVLEYLKKNLNVEDADFQSNGSISGITHTDEQINRPTSFDIVVSKGNKYVAIEVSFQVTTNSVIERKAGQAQARYNQIDNAGYKIAYVLDGAGNFQRETALRTICSYSHCTVAFSRSEINVLCEFIQSYLK